jgi:hypothetical protein
MKTVLATVATGKHGSNWKRYLEPSWRAYANRHGYGLVMYDRLLDDSPVARERKVSWQKWLLLEQPEVAAYDKVVWIDADIFINHIDAPAIDVDLDPGKFAICEETPYPADPLFAMGSARAEAILVQSFGQTYGDAKGGDLYAMSGFPDFRGPLLNTGVFVAGRREQAGFLRAMYDKYLERGRNAPASEMTPLSYELVTRGMYQLLDPRFNVIYVKALLSVLHVPAVDPLINGQIPFIAGMIANSWFLHFAGRQSDVWLTSFIKLERGRIGFDKKRLERLVREVTLPRYFGGKPGRKPGRARKPG